MPEKKLITGYCYRKNGYDFEVVERTGDVVIVSQDGGRWYEVFEILITQASVINGNVVESAEAPQGSEAWGKKAYTVYTIDQAREKAKLLLQNIATRNEKK